MNIFKTLFVFVVASLMVMEAQAHLSGFTDTSIQIAQPGVRIIYTLPIDSAQELPKVNAKAKELIVKDVQAQVEAIWSVSSNKRNCFLSSSVGSRLETIKAFQFYLDYQCPQGLDDIDISYQLFNGQWQGHQNFTRVLMAGEELRIRFAFDRQKINIAVKDNVEKWDKPLSEHFLSIDPNRDMKEQRRSNPSDDEIDKFSWADPAFITLGAKHIGLGWDHVLFILALLLVPLTWSRLIFCITVFTLAHSITLGLAYLKVLVISPLVTEPLIALTIIFLGLENALILSNRCPSCLRFRPLSILFFGLVHGVGLSYQLNEYSVSGSVIGRLLYFNLGVEIGQIILVMIFALPLMLIMKLSYSRRVLLALSIIISLFGCFWFAQRITDFI